MSLEYIDQLISHVNTFREQVETQTTEADGLRSQLEATREQLRVALVSLQDLQKLQKQLADKDQEITKLSTVILEVQQRLSNERRRSEQIKTQRDTLQKNLDTISAIFKLGQAANTPKL